MSMEALNLEHENSAVNRFDNLVNLVKMESGSESGWLAAPERVVNVSGEQIPIRIFAFAPQPLNYEEGSQYSPSLYVELGERTYAEDGKPLGEVLKFVLKRALLEQNKDTDQAQQQKAKQELEIIEEIVFAYQNPSPQIVV